MMINGTNAYQPRLFEQNNPNKEFPQVTEGAMTQVKKAIEVQRVEMDRTTEIEAQKRANNPPGSREWIA